MKKQMKCAKEFAKWLGKHELNYDTLIYVDGWRYKVDDAGKLVEDIECNVHDYIEYAGDFMTVATEGELYNIINGYCKSTSYADERMEEMDTMFSKYGKYYEQNDAWNFSLFDE